MATLFVVATPIGNLEDVTHRALRTLREAALVVAEDTRVTKKLLAHFGIATPLVSFHEYSDERALARIVARLAAGEDVALVTDAGTPGISDPGAWLVSRALAAVPELGVIPIPGASSLVAALSVSGMRAEPFVFLGFPPAKKGRQAFFRGLADRTETLVLFESPHRVAKTMDELLAALGPARPTFVGRELTKLHETHHRGTLAEVTAAVRSGTVRGEYVIVIGPA